MSSKVLKFLFVAILITGYSTTSHAQEFTSVSLDDFNAFQSPSKNWIIAGDAVADYNKQHDLRGITGKGVAVNNFSKNDRMHLVTKEEFGDLVLELDVMMAKNSNAGIYFEGRYEIQLLDSWKKLHASASDIGAVYMRYQPGRGTFEGTAPYMNVARAPGLWQHFLIKFRAPTFDAQGKKTANARFEQVYLNGVLVQQNTDVTGATASSMFQDDKATGPLVIQGDHGPVAIKNIKYRTTLTDTSEANKRIEWWDRADPVTVTPENRPAFIRAFVEHKGKKLTHAVSFGDPSQLNYSFDLKRGALFQVWRGDFMDLTRAWSGRGETQLAVPSGSVIALSDAQPIAMLENENANWPDSISFDSVMSKGFKLNQQRAPTFSYSINGMDIKDSVSFLSSADGISRTITVMAPMPKVYCRIATGSVIESIGDGLYAIDKKMYYLKLDKSVKPIIRTSQNMQELLVDFSKTSSVSYSIIW